MLTVIPLFIRKQTQQPPAILQDEYDEYLPYYFQSWRDAVHFVFWYEYTKKTTKKSEPKLSITEYYVSWEEKYYKDKTFTGRYGDDIFETLNLEVYVDTYPVKSSHNTVYIDLWTLRNLNIE